MAASLTLEELTQILDAPAVSSEGGRARGYQSPQQWRQQLALDDLEDREGLPRGLMTAVLTRESGGYPTAKSSAGAQGLFQLMPRTAQAYRADPLHPEQAADAAAKELGQHWRRYDGDLSQTLAAWNWGSGNLQKQGMQNAPKETRNFISWVTGLLSPRSAEAASPPARTGPLSLAELEQRLGTPPPAATGRSRLEEIEAELARRDARQPTYEGIYGTTPPQGRSSPSTPRGITYQDIYGSPPTAPGGTQAQPTGTPAEEPITPDARFLRLPSIQQLPLEERTQRFREFYALRPEFKEEFLRSEEPSSDLVVDIEKTSPPAPTGWRAGLPQTPEEWDRRMAPMRAQLEATSRAAIPMALSAVPGALAYQLGARVAPALGAIGKVVPPLLEAAGGYLGHRANVALGNEQEGTAGDVMALLPLATRGLGTAAAGWLERTVKDTPPEARDQLLGALMQLLKRGGAQGALTYALSGDPQLAAWVGGSVATARSLIGFALRNPVGRQLVEKTLAAGRAIGGAELGALLQLGKTGKLPEGWGGMTAPASEGERPATEQGDSRVLPDWFYEPPRTR